ncbi:MAG: redoxin domain-containing protein [Gemmataceae bacterium]
MFNAEKNVLVKGIQGYMKIALLSIFTISVLAVFFALFVIPRDAKSQEPKINADENLGLVLRLGKEVRPVTFVDTKGSKWQLHDQKDAKAIVVTFLDFKCPISNRYVSVLNALAEKYKESGVVLTAVICDVESAGELEQHVREFKVNFKVFYDPQHLVANHFLADTTPQCFVLDRDKMLRYVGAIDDQYQDRTTRLKSVKTQYLANAIDSVLANKPLESKFTHAIGCPITKSTKEEVTSSGVTFYKDLLPLLQKHCQRCHRPGDVAPFQLMTFDDAKGWADDIKDYVTSHRMPPWPIRGGLPLHDDFGLKDEEISVFAKWVDAGCPKGDIKDAPKPVVFPNKKEWEDENPPDIILEMPYDFHLAANGEDHYRMIVFPLNNKEELYINKTQFMPGNKRIVHHELTFYDGTGVVLDAQKRLNKSKPTGKGDEDYGPGYESGMGLGFEPNPTALTRNMDNPGGGLGVWVPGQNKWADPPRASHVVPPDSSIIMQIHYHRNGRSETDRSKLGIWLSKKKPEKYVHYILVDTKFLWIPKGAPNYKSVGSRVVEEDCELYLFKPHMHFAGKEMRVWHQPKDSKERKLIFDLRNWDYNWQLSYYTKEFYFLEKGSTLHVEATYDNSSRNPTNPFNPPRTLFLGENDEDEMGYCSVSYLTRNRPTGHNEFMNYFFKLREGALLKKAFNGGK